MSDGRSRVARGRPFSVFWTDTAFYDLGEIIDYLAGESASAASQALHRIEMQAVRLGSLPRRGRVVPELAAHSIHSYRELVVPPWRIVYRIEGSRVLVLAVLDGRRNLEDLLLDRFLRRRQ